MTLAFVPVDPREAVIARFAHFRRSHFKVRTDIEADFAEWFGLRSGEARLLAVLYQRGAVQRDSLLRLASLTPTTLRLYLVEVRQALGEGAIPPQSEDGTYQLTQLGRAACDEAIEKVGVAALRKELAA